MAALEISAYNPEKDPDGSGATTLINLITEILAARYETLKAIAAAAPPPPVKAPKVAPVPAPAPEAAASEEPSAAGAPENFTFEPVPGESWSSDSLTDSPADTETGEHTGADAARDAHSEEDADDSESGEPKR